MNFFTDDRKNLFICIGASVITWNAARSIRKYWKKEHVEWIPVGRIQSLHVYPIKSCKPKDVFSLKCTALGSTAGEYKDRFFLVIDGATGKFYTARQKPQMILTEVTIREGLLTLKHPDHGTASVRIDQVLLDNEVKSGLLFSNTRTDGLDCGDDISGFFSKVVGEPNARLIMYKPGLFTERHCITSQDWWNNPVPKRTDEVAYADLAPFLIATQASVDDLNERLEKKVTASNFRANIVVEGCEPWDEDKWSEVKFGDVELQCFKPCTRCVLTTVDPSTGNKDPANQPLKELRQFRLAPPGKLRKEFKDSPIFGVNAGLVKEGYIHVGQTVWAKYKPTAY